MVGNRQADERAWFDKEVEAHEFQHARLHKLERLWSGMGQPIPFACQDWTSTKAAYRFLSNDRVREQDIPSGNFQASADRFKAAQGAILVLQETTTISYRRERPELFGYPGKTSVQRGKHGLFRSITTRHLSRR
ncbi:hypothetical protein R75465_05476 [Paraburkholderia aspalathi]|uniref:IS4/Tn5 family transposase DNA-binding protein n=1 Tax=Paraburkholderia aspalathi TaxID=1324617 RepID=UPI001B2B3778|nr:transposase [Paraburkholderia aspalathi]CAE6812890.1 hypothetical protein R75465_05476 [Paraburkholderia aspalathi]